MNRLSRIFAAIAVLCCELVAAAPYFHHVGVSDGLAHPSVMSICQDSLGRIWFGTENGLSIFDGSRMESRKPYELHGGQVAFRGGVVKPLLCDSRGNVHFLTGQEWVCCDARTDALHTLMEGQIDALFLRDGQACAVSGRQCFRWNAEAGRLETMEEMPFDGVRDYHIARNGKHWLVCGEGLFCGGPGNEFEKISAIRDLSSIFESSCGEIWSGSNAGGLVRVVADTAVTVYDVAGAGDRGFGCDNVRGITEDKNGNIWFGTFRGLYCYNPDTDRFVSYVPGDSAGSLSQSSVHPVFVDADGVLWAGTYYGGVNYTDTGASAFSFWGGGPSDGDLSSPVVGHLAESLAGNIYICMEGGGINRLDPDSGNVRRYDGLPFTHAKWLCEDSDGRIHVGTNRCGVFTVDTASGRAVQALRDDGDGCTPRSVVNVILQYGDDWILSTDDGVYLHSCENGADTLLYHKTDGIRYVHAVISGDELWLASSEVVVFDLKTLSLRAKYPVGDGVQARPMRLLVTQDDVFATTFGQGLFRLDDGHFIHVPGASLNTSGYQIVSVDSSRIAISGERGLQVLDAATGRSLRTFLIGGGLPLDAQVMDSGLLVTADGTVYVGGVNGLVSFRLDDETMNVPDEVYFSSLDIAGNPVRAYDGSGILAENLPFLSRIRLKGRQARIDVGMAVRGHTVAQNWSDYEWRLKGRDSQWESVDAPKISIESLLPGRYSLQLRRSSDRDEVIAELGLRVTPPAYASWWAMLLYVAVAAGLSYIVLRTIRIRRESARIVAAEREEKQRIQEMNETKLRFFTTVSHELRSPLTLIIAQIDSIFGRFKLSPQLHHKISKVMDQAVQMNEIVSELIDFRKYEQNVMKIRVAPVDVNLFVGDVMGKFAEMADSKGISLSFEKSPLAPEVFMDVYQMQKVMRNLILNALKYTPDGGSVTLRTAVADDGRVEIHVRDTGVGIPAEECGHIFERFYQVRSGVSNGVEGSGIGLALVRDIVLKHGGEVSVSSESGVGSDFVVTLRKGAGHFAGDDMVSVEESVPVELVPDNSLTGKYSIVIAEDNREMAELLQEVFSVRYKVYQASDGKEALDLVKAVRPDIVLSDVMMPGMSGTELCATIKSNPQTAHIPVVLLTALADSVRQLSGLQSGADDYVAKPFQSRLLLARCNNLVSAAHRPSSSVPDDVSEDLSRRVTRRGDKEFVDKVTSLIESHLAEPDFGVDALADSLHMSRSSFYGHFKAVTGETPNDYISSVRLRRACAMLTERPDIPVSQIAESLGFGSQQYFSRRFKDAYGVSPVSWRRSPGKMPVE